MASVFCRGAAFAEANQSEACDLNAVNAVALCKRTSRESRLFLCCFTAQVVTGNDAVADGDKEVGTGLRAVICRALVPFTEMWTHNGQSRLC